MGGRGRVQVPQYECVRRQVLGSVLTFCLAEARFVLLFLPCCVAWTSCPCMAKSFSTMLFQQECWDYRCEPRHLAFLYMYQQSNSGQQAMCSNSLSYLSWSLTLLLSLLLILLLLSFWDRVSVKGDFELAMHSKLTLNPWSSCVPSWAEISGLWHHSHLPSTLLAFLYKLRSREWHFLFACFDF